MYSYFSFHLSFFPNFYFNIGKKLRTYISFSKCFCYYKKHPNNDYKIFRLPFPARFQQRFHDWSLYLGTNQIWRNLNEHSYYLISSKSVIWQIGKLFSIPVVEYASFSHQARMVKTNLVRLISNFSKCYFKTDTICFLFFSLHAFTALEFDSNHFGILLWKMVKPRHHNDIKQPIGKIFLKYKPIRHYFVMFRK